MLCPNCDREWEAIGKHFRGCGYPDLSDKQKDIMIGCLMGDGTIDNRNIESKNPRFTLANTNEAYAYEVHKKLQPFANITKVERKRRDIYNVRVVHPWVENLTDWYSTGEKVFPELSLNPTILKHWYCCDGCKKMGKGGSWCFHISMKNEVDRQENIRRMFNELGISISFYRYCLYTRNGDYKPYQIMGEPPKGMEYKWP